MISRRIFSALLAFAFFSSVAESAELSLHSYDDAVAIAKEQGKMVYVLFGGDHCPWCHKQKDVLLKDDVVDALSDYIVCHVDTSTEREVSSKYRIRTIPVSMILDSNERVVKKNVGYMDEAKFLKWLR